MKRFFRRNGKLLLYAIILVLCFFIGRYAYSYTFPPNKELRTVYSKLDPNTAIRYYSVSEDHKTLTTITLSIEALTPKIGPYSYTGYLLIEIKNTNGDYIVYKILDYGPDGLVDWCGWYQNHSSYSSDPIILAKDSAQKLYNDKIHAFYLSFMPSI